MQIAAVSVQLVSRKLGLFCAAFMEILIPLAFGFAIVFFKHREQRQRIALLGAVLSRFEIEKLMATLIDGYLRALGEDSPERQSQVWSYLAAQEERLIEQLGQFATAAQDIWADDALVSTLPVVFPRAHKVFPAATFDVRRVLQHHATRLEAAVRQSAGAQPKDRAFTISAELLLLQHTCHWFCRSKAVASARLLKQHRTSYPQVLASVAPDTRLGYDKLTRAKV